MERIACRFCDTTFSKIESRMEKHIEICKKCPPEVKQNYLEIPDIANFKTTRKSEFFFLRHQHKLRKHLEISRKK